MASILLIKSQPCYDSWRWNVGTNDGACRVQRKEDYITRKPWATTGNKKEARNIINSLFIDPQGLEDHVLKLYKKYDEMKENEVRWSATIVKMLRL